MYKRKRGRPYNTIGRWTVTRQAILDTFIKSRGHLTAEDVYMRVRKMHSAIGMATVYRNLGFLRQQRLLNRYRFGEGGARYELNDDERDHHHHLICTKCGKVKDYSEFVERELALMKDLEKELAEKYNFEISSHQLHFYGLCDRCSRD